MNEKEKLQTRIISFKNQIRRIKDMSLSGMHTIGDIHKALNVIKSYEETIKITEKLLKMKYVK